MHADCRRASDFNQAGIVSGPAGGDQAPDSNQASMGAEGDGLAGVSRPTDPPSGGICVSFITLNHSNQQRLSNFPAAFKQRLSNV